MTDSIVPDIPRLYTAFAEWAACMVYVLALKRRYRGVRLWGGAALALGVFCGAQIGLGYLPLWLWIPGMLLAVCFMYLTVYALCDVRPVAAIFWTARVFVLAEFAASVEWQFHYYFVDTFPALDNVYADCAFLAVVYAAVYGMAYLLERRYMKSNVQLEVFGKDIIAAAVTAVATFLISNVSFVSKNTPLSGTNASEIFYIRTLVDLCGVAMLYAQQEQRLWLHSKVELAAMQNILDRQYEQYRQSKDNIELLNRRYHDLKHQIAVIRAEENPEKKSAYLEEMETGIRMYEAENKTGNGVLDTLLTGKSMACVEKGVNFTCVADGTLLDFMNVMDICSIVGNALDNAIESVCKLADKEKRIVKMAVYKQNDLLMMRFENYIDEKPRFENGLPLTTKPKKENHGYGFKSIKYSTEKYNGTVKLDVEDNWFVLCLLIPIPANGA